MAFFDWVEISIFKNPFEEQDFVFSNILIIFEKSTEFLFIYKVYNFLHFSSTKNFQILKSTAFCLPYKAYDYLHFFEYGEFSFFFEKRPLQAWGIVKRCVLIRDFDFFWFQKWKKTY